MHQEQRRRAQAKLAAHGVERALFANLNSVKWLAGLAPPVQLGPNLFAGGPLLVWYQEGRFTLLAVDTDAAAAEAFGRQPDCAVVIYPGYTIKAPLAGAEHLVTAFQQVVAGSAGRDGQVGVEMRDVPAWLMATLRETLPPSTEFIPIDGWLEPLRAVKTEEELDKLRKNFALTDVGHAAARRAVQAGQREIDVWTAIHSAVERAAGCRVPMGNDCIVGHRSANIGGWPLDYEIRPDDAFIVDLSTVWHGYWSDSCATYYPGEPTAQQIAMHRTVSEALAFAISLVRPGAVAQEIDRRVRQFIADAGYPVYPHHTGHGVGVSGHEAPRLVPYSQEVLKEGMVFMLEPAIYLPGETGVRLEDAVMVASGGAEVLTKHDKSLP